MIPVTKQILVFLLILGASMSYASFKKSSPFAPQGDPGNLNGTPPLVGLTTKIPCQHHHDSSNAADIFTTKNSSPAGVLANNVPAKFKRLKNTSRNQFN